MKKPKWLREIKAVGWDVDGTLYPEEAIPDYEFREPQIKAVMEKKGWEKQRAEKEFERLYQECGSRTQALDQLGIDGIKFFTDLWDEMPLEKYIKKDEQLVKVFKRLTHLKHFVVTNAGRLDQVERKLKLVGLKPSWFKPIVSGYLLGAPKPEIRPFKEAVRLVGLKPKEILFVGDRVKSDILPAKQLGMRTALVGGKSEEADIAFLQVYDIVIYFKS